MEFLNHFSIRSYMAENVFYYWDPSNQNKIDERSNKNGVRSNDVQSIKS